MRLLNTTTIALISTLTLTACSNRHVQDPSQNHLVQAASPINVKPIIVNQIHIPSEASIGENHDQLEWSKEALEINSIVVSDGSAAIRQEIGRASVNGGNESIAIINDVGIGHFESYHFDEPRFLNVFQIEGAVGAESEQAANIIAVGFRSEYYLFISNKKKNCRYFDQIDFKAQTIEICDITVKFSDIELN
ncbi:TPA: hypothetical protein ACPVZG_000151 [Vibrio parahaemolyticus]